MNPRAADLKHALRLSVVSFLMRIEPGASLQVWADVVRRRLHLRSRRYWAMEP
jgi:hypothetical protein